MTAKQALLQKLRGDAPTGETVDESLERQKHAWIEDLRQLMGKIAGWLAEPEGEGLVKLEQRSVELAEEDLGPYTVPALSIHVRTVHPRAVKVEPKGMRIPGVIASTDRRIVGARGRVDVTCGAARAILLRGKEAGAWRIVRSNGDAVELTEESFANALNELIE